MSIYPQPNWTESLTTFNTANYEQSITTSSISTAYLNANFLKYPIAQGDETFINTSNTGNSAIAGTLSTNTIQGTTTSSNISLFPLLTTQTIELGSAMTTGTIKIGTSTNSNHLGLLDFTGNTMNHTTPTTGTVHLCYNQTTGALGIANNASRTGAVNICTGASALSLITIGSTNTTTNLNGTVKNNSIPLTPSVVSYAISTTIPNNLPQNLLVTMTLASQTINVPAIPYTGQKINFINTSAGTSFIQSATYPFIGYGLASSSALTIYTGQTAIIQFDGTNFIVLFKSNETYAPTLATYTTNPSYSSLAQVGYVFSATNASLFTTSATGVRTGSITVSVSPYPLGVYAIAIRGLITVGTSSNTVRDYTVAYSTTTATSGFISNLYTRDLASATALTTGQTMTRNVAGVYQRTALTQTYVVLDLNTTVYLSTGITAGIIYTITRIA
jgi:hypothetical protein